MNDSLKKVFPKLVQQLEKPCEIVNLGNTPISLEEMKLIHKYLRNNVTVKNLYLWASQIGDEHCKTISELLKENTTIKFINLDDNPIWADGMNYLALGLKHNTTIERLSLQKINQTEHVEKNSGNPEVNSSIKEIGNLLSSQDCMIETLDLDNNPMRLDEARCLGKGLSLNKYLTTLNLYECKMKDEDCVDICEGLKKNSTLTALNLSYNRIGAVGGKGIAEVLSSPICALERLNISDNPIRGGLNAIFESLVENNKLTELKIYSTGISPRCLKQLGDLFQKNKTLSEFYFMDSLGDSILSLIADSLKQNHIKKLHLAHCKLTHTSATKILETLPSNTSLNYLIIGTFPFFLEFTAGI